MELKRGQKGYRAEICKRGHRYPEGERAPSKGCRNCVAAAYKRWYDKNQPAQVARVTKYINDNRDKVNQRVRLSYQEKKRILVEEAGGACVRCSFSEHLAALDFDHLDPTQKLYGVLRGNRSLAAAREEAKKCQLLCANCHRIWTSDPEAFAKQP